jgi:hypothetical protein
MDRIDCRQKRSVWIYSQHPMNPMYPSSEKSVTYLFACGTLFCARVICTQRAQQEVFVFAIP